MAPLRSRALGHRLKRGGRHRVTPSDVARLIDVYRLAQPGTDFTTSPSRVDRFRQGYYIGKQVWGGEPTMK